MIFIDIMPEKNSLIITELKTLFRIIVYIIVGMRSIDKKEGRYGLPNLIKIPRSGIGKMLDDVRAQRMIAKAFADIATGNEVMISFHPASRNIGNKICGQIDGMNNRIRQILSHMQGGMPKESTNFQYCFGSSRDQDR